MPDSTAPSLTASGWLLRIPEIFSEMAPEVLRRLDAKPLRQLGGEYHLVRLADPGKLHEAEAGIFVRWNLPVQHSWPCCPQDMDGFIEKAAQALLVKFGAHRPQTILVGRFDSASPHSYYKSLASNLRGRMLQLFTFPASPPPDAEAQDSGRETLFCMVGKEGLFCGLQSPRDSNGFYAGGSKYISRGSSGAAISRAGAKIAEALHYLSLHQPVPPPGSHWLELGASPGGMTAELLAAGCRVTAVDRAPLDRKLDRASRLEFIYADAGEFEAPPGTVYDAVLSDLNGDARESMRKVIRQSRHLKAGGIVIFTLKTPGVDTAAEMLASRTVVVNAAAASGLRLIAGTHLTGNRREFTLFFTKSRAS